MVPWAAITLSCRRSRRRRNKISIKSRGKTISFFQSFEKPVSICAHKQRQGTLLFVTATS
jgi:hypothetical protein